MEEKSAMEKTKIPYDTISTQSASDDSVMKRCCFFVSLRTGCLILGYFNLVVNSFETIFLLGFTTMIGVVSHGFDHFDRDNTTPSFNQVNLTSEEEKLILNRIAIVLCMIVIFNVLWLTLNVVFLVGVHLKRLYPIKCYISFASLRLIISLASLIHLIISNKTSMEYIVTHSFNIGLSAYFLQVFYSYMQQLKKERAEVYPTIVVTKEYLQQQS